MKPFGWEVKCFLNTTFEVPWSGSQRIFTIGQRYCFSLLLLWNVESFLSFNNTHRQIGNLTVKKSSKLLVFQHLIFFHEVLSVTGSGWLSQWGSCLLHKSCFNDKQQATSHILLPTMTMNWDYPGNTGVCLHQMHSNHFRLQWTCFITTCKPGTCVVAPVRYCLYITYNDKDHRWWQMILSVRTLSAVKAVSVIHISSSFTGAYSMTHSLLDPWHINIPLNFSVQRYFQPHNCLSLTLSPVSLCSSSTELYGVLQQIKLCYALLLCYY